MSQPLHLFEAFGVELEYMIVDRETLDVRPITDRVIHSVAGSYESEVDIDELGWSNELVLHVIELKTNGPADTLDGLADSFQRHVVRINSILAEHGAMLLPTLMHPWMNPHTETVLWPHDYSPVYETFDRIFDCRGHGWSNLQCVHLNLPFCGDEEFGSLHAAIRVLMPLLPALVASSPIIDGRATGIADNRLDVYRGNARRVPSVSGRVIPEPVFTRADYRREILERIYRDLEPLDPEGTLCHEWANARGAIARFDRDTIELRVLDIQECPAADLAVLRLIAAVVKALTQERWSPMADLMSWSIDPLEAILLDTIRHADRTVIRDARYLRSFGIEPAGEVTARQVWRRLFDDLFTPDERRSPELRPLTAILEHGSLSQRIVEALGNNGDRKRLHALYRELGDCLGRGQMFRA